MILLLRPVLVIICVSSAVTIQLWPASNCSQQGLRCTVTTSNCMDKDWLRVNDYTPSGPEDFNVSIDTRQDEMGHLHPTLVAKWKIKDDGSVSYLTASEVHVLVMSTNQNLCVRYSFKDKLSMRSPTQEKWSFSANMQVDPGQMYQVSVFNIPKTEVGHSPSDVSTDVTTPGPPDQDPVMVSPILIPFENLWNVIRRKMDGHKPSNKAEPFECCLDPKMQMTMFCIERGSLWQPNISLTAVSGRSALDVSFTPDTLCEDYVIIVSCSTYQDVRRTHKANNKTLNVTFHLDKCPKFCCQFDVEIKPLFPQCGQDCARRRRTLDICPEPTDARSDPVYTFVIMGVVFLCGVTAVVMYILCPKQGKPSVTATPLVGEIPQERQLKQPPKVLVIYSQDHRLYSDVVLKLCTFLQAKCGTKVLVDLLDATSVGMLGRLRWLEWQRQQLRNPSDKILVLCSRGVQAKWKAMCGQGRVTLREDVLSPTDDMLTPFLNLFVPDMHQVGMLGKYLVAYFDDISGEQDVPSVFDILVKYKLMKHFEELYFRILDIEKYQPGQVNQIKGIGGDEYFNCQSGRALKKAIDTFKAYQLENPDWFEKECVNNEEEVMTEANRRIGQLQIPPVLENVPLIRYGPPPYINEVEIQDNGDSLVVLTPELNAKRELSSAAELTPVVDLKHKHQYLSNSNEVLTHHVYPHSPRSESVYIVEPVLNNLQPPRQNWLSLHATPYNQIPTEDEEQDSMLPMGLPSACSEKKSSAPQDSVNLTPQEFSCASIQREYFHQSQIRNSQAVEMEEDEVLEPIRKPPCSGSDQGYISKMSSQHERPIKNDPLVALRMLQEELFNKNLG